MDNLLAHLCTIQTRSSSTNSLGEPTYTWSAESENVKCRLVTRQSGGMMRLPSGEFVERMPVLFLKAGASISETKRIIGTSGFSDTYEVLKVRNIYNDAILHHIECDLRKVV